jgi:pentatricopeptide repeat protein
MFISHKSFPTRFKYFITNKPLFHPFSSSLAVCPQLPPTKANFHPIQQGRDRFLESKSHTDIISKTKLIHEHCQAGRTNEARKVFDEMPERNVVTYSTIIYRYSCIGLFKEAIDLFKHMLHSGISPNSFSLVAVLLGAAGIGTSQLTETLHATIVKSGFGSSSFLRSALLDCYAKCNDPKKSFALFSEFCKPDLVACNTMISGFVYSSLFEEALLLYKKIRVIGFDLQPRTMISVLESCAGYGSSSLCESLHGYTIKNGFDLDVYVSNSLFKMYLSFGNVDIVNRAFKLLSVKDVVTWTAFMGFLLEKGQAHDVLDLFFKMRCNGIVPDKIAMLNLVRACALLGNSKICKLVHSCIMVQGLGFESSLINSLISMYLKCEDVVSAKNLFDLMEEKNLVSWTCMISGYMQNGFPVEGMKLFHELRRENKFIMDAATAVTLLAICGDIVDFQLVKQFHADSLKLGLYHFVPVKNALITVYGKCGCLEFSCNLFKEISNKSVVSWNAMILAHGINGEGNKAVDLFVSMIDKGFEPDNITYLNTLMACSHNGLVNEGLDVLKRMLVDKGIRGNIKLGGEHITCVVHLLSRAGHLEHARNLMNHFREKGSVNAWKALLGGLFFRNDPQVMKEVGREILQKGMGDFANLVLVSNACASVGRFESVENLRPPSKSGLMKNVGLSYVDFVSW